MDFVEHYERHSNTNNKGRSRQKLKKCIELAIGQLGGNMQNAKKVKPATAKKTPSPTPLKRSHSPSRSTPRSAKPRKQCLRPVQSLSFTPPARRPWAEDVKPPDEDCWQIDKIIKEGALPYVLQGSVRTT